MLYKLRLIWCARVEERNLICVCTVSSGNVCVIKAILVLCVRISTCSKAI
jgi:hypothetical protein